MGVLTLQNMRDEVRYTIGGFDDTLMPDARVDRWIRQAQIHVCRPAVYPHRELSVSGTFTLTTGTASYPFTGFGASIDNVQAIRRVHHETRGKRLLPMSHRQYLDRARDGGGTLVTGEPTHYAVEGSDLYSYPAATSTYNGDTIRVFYFGKPAVLSAAGSVTEIAEDWDEVIIQGAVWRGFRAINQVDRAELAKVEFGQLINEITDRLTIEHMEDHDGRTFEVEIQDYQEIVT